MERLHIKNRYLCLVDIFLCFLAYGLILLTVFPVSEFPARFVGGILQICGAAILYIALLIALRLYKVDWLYASAFEYIRLLAACLMATLCSVFAGFFLSHGIFAPKLNLAAAICAAALVCSLRFMVRLICKLSMVQNRRAGARTLIVGAGRLAVTILRDIQEGQLPYNVIGLIDDNMQKGTQYIYGAGVLGTSADIERICKEKRIEVIIFAIHNISAVRKAEILDICSQTGAKVKILPNLGSMLAGANILSKAREVAIEDLLERDPIQLDNQLLQEELNDKVVLVTGGGGSIGSELCRQIVRFRPRRLIILDAYENTTYELQNELEEHYPNLEIHVLIASVRDKKRLSEIFMAHQPEVVFHAAAHKHVPLMEYSPGEAIKNNVFGTYNTALCAEECGAKRFVLISTDKAVNPTNVMGATKHVCEMIVQAMNGRSRTEFVVVRFGNVLGSNGSVIPRFRKQIEEGGPVTVTHPEITRFFMTIPEAAQLVLQAAAYAKGGEIFILDMGQPVKIFELAKKMIRLSGYRPEIDIPIRFTGLRPGEKLYEELLMQEEGLEKTAHGKIFVGRPLEVTYDTLEKKLLRLETALTEDADTIKKILAEVVPTYQNGGCSGNKRNTL